jgi:hypothetical protein
MGTSKRQLEALPATRISNRKVRPIVAAGEAKEKLDDVKNKVDDVVDKTRSKFDEVIDKTKRALHQK